METVNKAATEYKDKNGRVITKAEYNRLQTGEPESVDKKDESPAKDKEK